MSLLKEISGGQPEKKRKLEPSRDNSISLTNSIIHCMLDLREKIKMCSADINKIEVEVRVGMILKDHRRWHSSVTTCYPGTKEPRALIVPTLKHSLNFDAGIDETLMGRIKRVLKDSGNFLKTEQIILQRSSEGPPRLRWEVPYDNPETGECTLLEAKEKLFNATDICLLAHHYDVRIDCATETRITTSVPSTSVRSVGVIKKNEWKMERLKRRVSFSQSLTHSNSTGQKSEVGRWRVDLTEVDTRVKNTLTDPPSAPLKSFEVEFELGIILGVSEY